MTKLLKTTGLLGAAVAFALLAMPALSLAQDTKRTELKRGDLTGKDMDVIMAVVELPVGSVAPLHTHPGEEAYYVIEGGTVETADGKRMTIETGTGMINVRDVPHAGWKIVGDKTIKLLTVHIVDKGKPMTVVVK
jgi:quercetin dioxygenase-like cupin family protein